MAERVSNPALEARFTAADISDNRLSGLEKAFELSKAAGHALSVLLLLGLVAAAGIVIGLSAALFSPLAAITASLVGLVLIFEAQRGINASSYIARRSYRQFRTGRVQPTAVAI